MFIDRAMESDHLLQGADTNEMDSINAYRTADQRLPRLRSYTENEVIGLSLQN